MKIRQNLWSSLLRSEITSPAPLDYQYQPIQLTNTIPSVRKSISQSPLRRSFLLIPLAYALAWFALSSTLQAVDPAPDGGYPNGNTAEGEDALFSLTTGINNTANGDQALFSNRTGSFNTANGKSALDRNTKWCAASGHDHRNQAASLGLESVRSTRR